jgi:hypothetical protein
VWGRVRVPRQRQGGIREGGEHSCRQWVREATDLSIFELTGAGASALFDQAGQLGSLRDVVLAMKAMTIACRGPTTERSEAPWHPACRRAGVR